MNNFLLLSVPVLLTCVLYFNYTNIDSARQVFINLVLLLAFNALFHFNVSLDFDIANKLLHYIVNVGIREELVKLFAFIMVVWLTKTKDKGHMFVLFILSHTMFALMENYFYYLSDPSTLAMRFIVCTMIHTCLGVIQAFALIMYKRIFPVIFLLAVTWHGMYDFLLMERLAIPAFVNVMVLISVSFILLTMLLESNIVRQVK